MGKSTGCFPLRAIAFFIPQPHFDQTVRRSDTNLSPIPTSCTRTCVPLMLERVLVVEWEAQKVGEDIQGSSRGERGPKRYPAGDVSSFFFL